MHSRPSHRLQCEEPKNNTISVVGVNRGPLWKGQLEGQETTVPNAERCFVPNTSHAPNSDTPYIPIYCCEALDAALLFLPVLPSATSAPPQQ